MPKSASKGVSCHMLPPTSCQLSIIIHYVLTWGMFLPAGGKLRQRCNRFWKHTYFIRSMHILRYVTGLGGGGC